MMRALPLIVFIILALALGVALMQRSEPKLITGMIKPAPLPTLSVLSLDKRAPWNAEALKGHVTLINFFASWCMPCAAEMPELAALKKQFPKLIMHGIVWNDDPATIATWLKKHGNPFGHLWLDEGGDATIDLGIRGIPESIIVDAQGNIRYRLPGPLTPDVRAREVDALIEKLLNEAKK